MKIKLKSNNVADAGYSSTTTAALQSASKRSLEEPSKSTNETSDCWRMPDNKVSSWSFNTWQQNGIQRTLSPQPPCEKRSNFVQGTLTSVNEKINSDVVSHEVETSPGDGLTQRRQRFRPSLIISDLNQNWRKPFEGLCASLKTCQITSKNSTPEEKDKSTEIQKEKVVASVENALSETPVKTKQVEVVIKEEEKEQVRKISSHRPITYNRSAPTATSQTTMSVPLAVYQSCIKQRDVKIEQLVKDVKANDNKLLSSFSALKEKDAQLDKLKTHLCVRNSQLSDSVKNTIEKECKIKSLQVDQQRKELRIQSLVNKIEEIKDDSRWIRGELQKKSTQLEEKMFELRKLQGARPYSPHVHNDLLRQNTNLREFLKIKDDALKEALLQTYQDCSTCPSLKKQIMVLEENQKKLLTHKMDLENISAQNDKTCLQLSKEIQRLQSLLNERRISNPPMPANMFCGISPVDTNKSNAPCKNCSSLQIQNAKMNSLLIKEKNKEKQVTNGTKKLKGKIKEQEAIMMQLRSNSKAYKSEVKKLTIMLSQRGVLLPAFIPPVPEVVTGVEEEFGRLYEHYQRDRATFEGVVEEMKVAKLKLKQINAEYFNTKFKNVSVPENVKNYLSYTLPDIKKTITMATQQTTKPFSFLTEVFYTDKPGYKCQFCIRFDSYGIRFDFRIYKGQFDEFLKWPFDMNLSLTVFAEHTIDKMVCKYSAVDIPLVHRQQPQFDSGNEVFKGKNTLDITDFITEDGSISFELIVD